MEVGEESKVRELGHLLAIGMIIATLLVAGCGAEQGEAPDLVGTKWTLVSLEGQPLIAGTEISLYVEEDYLGGKMTCNGYGGGRDSGGYTATRKGELTLGAILAVTVQLCSEPEGIMEQEQTYIETFLRTAGYRVTQERLELLDDAGKTALVYKRE